MTMKPGFFTRTTATGHLEVAKANGFTPETLNAPILILDGQYGLDYEKIYRSMAKPCFVFDGRNILDHKRLFEIGFNVFPIGKPARTHFN